ncbi:substrate-binding domain-containing protein [Caproiciproducens galactitolivorans]|uniref:D-ribose-binding periplasmic protein n=1 Tax=Caproiciproducens galactitolivorans TaxID=642589 RepID=A0A4Z0YEI6_9FIRM|nr:sugar ABC transporter substrate-binding protein [Caproiciproducens galactitolivorans]QEY34580.1 substrate-binding domain-containing protein [Caproiciproducens galactitolivorans]TGJ77631.1 D-ribose-binding periplasmic protein precursor [Caproiciproducens galactitolivorans]
MKTKRILAALMGGIMVLSMAACSGSSGSSTAASTAGESTAAKETASAGKDNSNITIGVILKTLSSEYWGYVAAGVKQAEKDLGVKVELQGPPSETSYNEQSNMIETTISAGKVNALVIAPLQPDMVVTKLQDATMPILFVDTDANYDKKVAFIGTSNEAAAKTGGEYIAKLIGKGKKAVLIGGVQGDTTCEARMKGYREGLEANGVEILGIQYANATADKAVQVMENFMQTYPQIDAVLCNNDDMAMGAQRAAAQAGRADKMKFMGFDGNATSVQSIIDGKETASVAQSPYDMGYQAVVNAVKAAKGETVEKNIIIETKLIDSSNAKEYLDKLNKMLGK